MSGKRRKHLYRALTLYLPILHLVQGSVLDSVALSHPGRRALREQQSEHSYDDDDIGQYVSEIKYQCPGSNIESEGGDIEQRCRRLCDRKINIKCDSFLEPCMGKLRSRRSQKLQADAPLIRKRSLAPGPETISSKDLTFVVFFAVGQRNAEAFPSHQYVEPELNFVPVLRRSHPGSRIVILSDMETPFAEDIGLEIYRVPMDSARLGRNAYANYYQYIGQRIFLEDLQKNGSSENVVFMDMDVLVLDSILEIFCQDYGYAVTINANSYDPVDIGVQFVHRNHYSDGIAFLQVLIDNYLDLVKHPNSFTTGQVVMRNTLEMMHADVMISTIANTATRDNSYCRTVQNGTHNVCFFPCLKYNFWEDCMDIIGPQLPQTVETYKEVNVKIIQFVAWRKPGLPIVSQAFLEDGIEGAYEAFANLPHTEKGVHDLFKFNANVTRVCYRDDKGCTSNYLDENVIWSKPSTTQN